MDPTALNTLGAAQVAVTQLGLGCGTLGDPDEVTPDTQAQETLAAAWSAGIRYFDTAPWYGNTKSEHRTGQFLRNQAPSDYRLSTKVGRLYSRPADPGQFAKTEYAGRWKGGLPFVLRFDYTANGIRRSYEDSLQRLGVNQVDCLVIHDIDPRHQKGEDGVRRSLEQLDAGGGFQELRALRTRGEIGAIGAGVNHLGMIPRFLEHFDLDYFLVAMPYTLLDQETLDGEFQLCESRGVKVIIGAPFASGVLATGLKEGAQYRYQPVPAEVEAKVRAIEALCERHGITLGAAALQFPLAHPSVVSIIPGANSPAQLEANVAAFRAQIPGAFWHDLKAAGLIHDAAPVPA